jgi:predicted nucleic acid-binding protein
VDQAFDALVLDGSVATCDVVRFELLFGVRDHREFVARREALGALVDLPITPRTWRRALNVCERVARRGPLHHRRVRFPDLLVAAAAELAELPVLHYDRHFGLIAEVTGQLVRAIAPLGSL